MDSRSPLAAGGFSKSFRGIHCRWLVRIERFLRQMNCHQMENAAALFKSFPGRFYFRPISTASSPATRLQHWKIFVEFEKLRMVHRKEHVFLLHLISFCWLIRHRSRTSPRQTSVFGQPHPSTLRTRMVWTDGASGMIFSRFSFIFNIESIIVLFVFTRNRLPKVVHFLDLYHWKRASMGKSCICSGITLAFTPKSYLKWKPAMFLMFWMHFGAFHAGFTQPLLQKSLQNPSLLSMQFCNSDSLHRNVLYIFA